MARCCPSGLGAEPAAAEVSHVVLGAPWAPSCHPPAHRAARQNCEAHPITATLPRQRGWAAALILYAAGCLQAHPGQNSTREAPPSHESSGAWQPCHCRRSSGFMAHTQSPQGACGACTASGCIDMSHHPRQGEARGCGDAVGDRWSQQKGMRAADGASTWEPGGSWRHFWHASHCTQVSSMLPSLLSPALASPTRATETAVPAGCCGGSCGGGSGRGCGGCCCSCSCCCSDCCCEGLRRWRLMRFASSSGSSGGNCSCSLASSSLPRLAVLAPLRVRFKHPRLLRLRSVCGAAASASGSRL